MHVPEESNSGLTGDVVHRAVNGDTQAAGELLNANRERLVQMVRFRLGADMQQRVDASDIIQEAFVDAARRMDELNSADGGRIYLWLRQIVFNKLLEACRYHLGTEKRDAKRDVSISPGELADLSTESLSMAIADSMASPSQVAMKAELQAFLNTSLEKLDEVDREVLILRHFEGLTTAEAAEVLGLSKSGAGWRYVRALDCLRNIMDGAMEISRSA